MTMTLKDTPDALRGLAKVIREHGTCAPMAVEHVADAIDAHLTKPTQSVDVDFTISDAEPRILTWHGSRGCRPATSAEVSLWDKLAAALQEKGNGN